MHRSARLGFNSATWRRVHFAGFGLITAIAGAWLAWTHPTHPEIALALLVLFTAAAAFSPWAWLVLIPAGLPLLNWAPWTGWEGAQEFDLLILGVVTGGLVRGCLQAEAAPASSTPFKRRTDMTGLWIVCWVLSAAVALWLGGSRPNPDGLALPFRLAGAEVFKGTIGACLLWPLIVRCVSEDAERTVRLFTTGSIIGLAGALAVMLWERVAYTGLLNLSDHYRIVGPFWEMHVGGAAIDVYLVAMWPLVLWLLWDTGSAVRWLVGASVLPVFAYAMLTTFSRGVYLAAAGSLFCLGALLIARHSSGTPARRVGVFALATLAGAATLAALIWAFDQRALAGLVLAGLLVAALLVSVRRLRLGWRPVANLLLALAVVIEVAALVGSSDFLAARAASTVDDMNSRMAHWQRQLDLLHGTRDWALGIGLGRRSEAYARDYPALGFAGRTRWVKNSADSGHVALLGPEAGARHRGRHALTQRVALLPSGYSLALDLRSPTRSHLLVMVCEMHLLYARRCQSNWISADATWRRAQVDLEGPRLSAGPAWAPRMAVLSLASLAPGSEVQVDNLSLLPRAGSGELLANGDFSDGRARWFELTQRHYLPWHADNLYLEVLVEQGLLGLATGVAGWLAVLWMLLGRPRGGGDFGLFLASSIVAVLLIGSVSSVLDVPRIGFLFFLIILLGAALATSARPRSHAASRVLPNTTNQRPA